MDYSLPDFFCPWDSPGKSTTVGCHALLLGIFPTQGSNPGIKSVSSALAGRFFTIWATWKAQIDSSFGFWGATWSLSKLLNSALVARNQRRWYVNKRAWLNANKTLFVDTKMWISSNCHVSQDIVLVLIFETFFFFFSGMFPNQEWNPCRLQWNLSPNHWTTREFPFCDLLKL